MSSRAAALDEEYVSAHFLATYKGCLVIFRIWRSTGSNSWNHSVKFVRYPTLGYIESDG